MDVLEFSLFIKSVSDLADFIREELARAHPEGGHFRIPIDRPGIKGYKERSKPFIDSLATLYVEASQVASMCSQLLDSTGLQIYQQISLKANLIKLEANIRSLDYTMQL